MGIKHNIVRICVETKSVVKQKNRVLWTEGGNLFRITKGQDRITVYPPPSPPLLFRAAYDIVCACRSLFLAFFSSLPPCPLVELFLLSLLTPACFFSPLCHAMLA